MRKAVATKRKKFKLSSSLFEGSCLVQTWDETYGGGSHRLQRWEQSGTVAELVVCWVQKGTTRPRLACAKIDGAERNSRTDQLKEGDDVSETRCSSRSHASFVLERRSFDLGSVWCLSNTEDVEYCREGGEDDVGIKRHHRKEDGLGQGPIIKRTNRRRKGGKEAEQPLI